MTSQPEFVIIKRGCKTAPFSLSKNIINLGAKHNEVLGPAFFKRLVGVWGVSPSGGGGTKCQKG